MSGELPSYYFHNEPKLAPQEMTGDQDLLKKYDLLTMYSKYVKQANGDTQNAEDETYFPYVKDLPGKMETKKDNYIFSLINGPEISVSDITTFDKTTLEEAFTLRRGPITGFDGSLLGVDDDFSGTPAALSAAGSDEHNGTGDGEKKHKKKKKKRKHENEYEDGEHGEHRKKKKRKRDKEREERYLAHEEQTVIID
ncbi:uncharacterized protein VTP21DRAFT_6304 [Calcarisporiella thermophila]|uniref:uncharacterized protein n=1 Tax=Calcarisporiella thermophila TaxID=911321 RepID=UPI003744334A